MRCVCIKIRVPSLGAARHGTASERALSFIRQDFGDGRSIAWDLNVWEVIALSRMPVQGQRSWTRIFTVISLTYSTAFPGQYQDLRKRRSEARSSR